jgi:predicted AAA+ superfamily ATPase
VGQWLSALEASGLITILEPYFDNHTKRIVKTPKLYFNDVGLLCFLLGLDARSAGQWAGFGSLWETFVFGELLKWREAHRPEAKLWFYRDKDGLEVDFLVEQGGRLDLIDAKSTELPEARDTRQVQSAAKVLGARVGAKALVTPTTKGFPLGEAVVWSGWSLSNSLTAVP